MKPKDLALTIALGGAVGGGGDEDITKGTMAPNFSAEADYTAGGYVWHSGKLYRFTADHAAGSWDGTDAEEAPLSAGIGDLKSEISGLDKAVFEEITLTFDNYDGKYIKNNGGLYGTAGQSGSGIR